MELRDLAYFHGPQGPVLEMLMVEGNLRYGTNLELRLTDKDALRLYEFIGGNFNVESLDK